MIAKTEIAKIEPFIIDRLATTSEEITVFCQRWDVVEMALFGSVLRDDFHAGSDIDVLVQFSEFSSWNLFDHVHMHDELALIFRRKVDIAEERGLVNPYRKHSILSTCQRIYTAK